jgi:HEAT repeat protein
MGIFKSRKPNVKSLARRGNVDRLAAAASYRDLTPTRDGTIADLGRPVREEAVVALGELGTDEAAAAVAHALHDPDDRVRSKAVEALENLRQPVLIAEALPTLREMGGNAHPLALDALRDLQRPGLGRALVEALVYQSGDDRLDEDDAMLVPDLLSTEDGAQESRNVVEVLIRALSDESEIVADRTEQLLVLLAPVSADALEHELSDGGAAPHRAASALGKMGDVRALDTLVNALDDPDARVRAESCVALGELRDPAAVEPLLRAARDPEHVVRAGAGSALDRIGTVAVVVGVSAMLRPLLADLRRAIPPNGAPRRGVAEGANQPLDAGTTGHAASAGGVADIDETGLDGLDTAGEPTRLLRRLAQFIDRLEDTHAGE